MFLHLMTVQIIILYPPLIQKIMYYYQQFECHFNIIEMTFNNIVSGDRVFIGSREDINHLSPETEDNSTADQSHPYSLSL